jgi:hypothetical protein
LELTVTLFFGVFGGGVVSFLLRRPEYSLGTGGR